MLEYPPELQNPLMTNVYAMNFAKNERSQIKTMKIEGVFSLIKLNVATVTNIQLKESLQNIISGTEVSI